MTEPTPGTPDRVSRLVVYFRENRDRFTGDALKRAATEAGYTPAEIEAAWSQVGWGSAETAMSRPPKLAVSALVAIVYVAGLYLGAIGLGSNPRTMDLALPAVLVALLGGLLIWVATRESNPAIARGIGCGIVIAILLPVVLFLTIIGMCLVTGSALPFVPQ
jgi:hypothetical protein